MSDLPLIAERVQDELLAAESMNCPPDRLEYFELFLEELGVLIDQEQMQSQTNISTTADLSQIYPGAGNAGAPQLPSGGANAGPPGPSVTSPISGPPGGGGVAGLPGAHAGAPLAAVG